MTNFDVYLADAKTVAIAGHVRPDGDCAGSCLATYNYIKNYFPHVKVDLYLEPIPNIFKFMKRSEEILSEWPDDRKYDLFIAQDCGDAKRLGNAAKYFESAEHTICVDHHVSNQNFAEHNYIFPDASSTCELIFELLPDERIDREIAECIYTGMVHDTGVFQYSCTSRKTMEIAGKLIEKGINFPKIVDETFFTKTYNQNRIMGLALMKSVLHLDGKCISSVITKQEMEEYDVLPKHLDGIVSQLRVTKDVEVAIFLYELEDGRSKKTALENNEEKGYTMVNGIINVYKEKGYTSFDVVAKLRGIFKQKKIGHTGTLDPDAEGVLPVCLGKATKVCDLLTDKSKEYETVLLLGKVTDTQDITGTVLEEKDVKVTEEAVRETVLSFVGDYMQIPPMYSALKVNGKKLCDLAREGKTVERQARPVKILTIDILDVTLPRVRMRVHCSKGTYIRTLCQDIGEKLGCGGCMESLLRTQVSEFLLKDALKIGEIGQLVQECAKELPPEAWSRACFPFVRSVDSVFTQYQKVVVPEQFAKVLYNGNRIEPEMIRSFEASMQQKPIRIYDEKDHFIGIYEFQQERGNFKPVKVFMEE